MWLVSNVALFHPRPHNLKGYYKLGLELCLVTEIPSSPSLSHFPVAPFSPV